MTDDRETPWTQVPPEEAAKLDALSETCDQLAKAWGLTAAQLADPPSGQSAIRQDERWFYERHADAPEGLVQAVGQSASAYVDAMGQHLQAVSALLQGRRLTLSIWAVVRAELELAGRVGWLLDPGSDDDRVNGSQRVARLLMDGLAAVCRTRYSAGNMRGEHELERSVKQNRERIRDDIERVFPGARVDWRGLGDEDDWTVGGETYMKLGVGVDQFSHRWLGDARGMYDRLSDLTHPSLPALAAQIQRIDRGDRLEMVYVVEPETTNWQMQLACQALYRVAHLVTGYFALPDEHLEMWAGEAHVSQPSWFAAEDDSG